MQQPGILHFVLTFLLQDLHENDREQSSSFQFVCDVRYATVLRSFVLDILQHPQTEYADLSETLLKEHGNFSLVKVLNDPKILPYLISLSVTDQPAERPTLPPHPEEREKHVVIKLSVPRGAQVKDTQEFVTSIFQLVDIVGTKFASALRPDTKSKLKKVREELDKQLKVEATKEQKDEVCCSLSTLSVC